MNLEQVRNSEQLKHLLVKAGLSKEMITHRAFDVLIKDFISHLNSGSISKVDINKNNVFVSMVENAITIEHTERVGGTPIWSATISVPNKNGVELRIIEYPKDDKKGLEKEVRNYSGKLEEGKLVISTTEGISILDIDKQTQLSVANNEERTFDTDGIEIYKVIEEGSRRTSNNTGSLKDINYKYMNSIDTKTEFRRVGIDLAWVNHERKGETTSKLGYAVLNNESGLQKMKVSPGFYMDYISSSVPRITEEEYAKKIVSGNSKEVREALTAKYKPADRFKTVWTREEEINQKSR